MKFLAKSGGLVLVVLAVVAIWARNRDILSDLYDYSSVISAAGKLEAGLRPYVDFRSTMQSAGYGLNRAVEMAAGANYAGLTWGGLGWALGGVLILTALWRRELGLGLAVALAGAVGVAGLSQHVVIFYNPVGLLCLAIVAAAMPGMCRGGSLWSGRGAALLAALVLGGMNKANFQGLAVALAGALVLTEVAAGRMSGRRLWGWWCGLVVVGVLVPIGLELWWTGASLAQWRYNVVDLAEERVGFIALIFSPVSYVGPTYDLHHHLLFKPLHAIGVLLTMAFLVASWRADRALKRRLAMGILAIGGSMGAVMLTVTNVESIALTSLGTLIVAVVVAVAGGLLSHRWVQMSLGAAAVWWMVVGGWAAWMGSRVLYGRPGSDRASFVRLVDAPPSLRYLEGVRLDRGVYESLLLVAREVARIQARDGDARHVLFGDTLEWLERAHPESIMEGMPVWYHVGTALRSDDGPWLIEHFERKGVTDFFTHPAWELWPTDFQAYLDTHYQANPLGMLRHYERRVAADAGPAELAPTEFLPGSALEMIGRTNSTVHLGTTQVWGAKPEFMACRWGDIYGATGSWTWNWLQPMRDAEGTLVLLRIDRGGERSGAVEVEWRIRADDGGEGEVLWSGRTTVDAARPEHRVPWTARANGRRIRLEVTMRGERAEDVFAGWREVRLLQVGAVDDGGEPPRSLAGDDLGATDELVAGRQSWSRGEWTAPGVDGPERAAAKEVWMKPEAGAAGWRCTWSVEPAAANGGVTPILMLLWSKGSRLEILQQLAPPVSEGEFAVGGHLPEAGGWVGVALRPVEEGRPLNARLVLKRWAD